MSDVEVRWEAPGPGPWYFAPEHMPTPVTTLFADLFPRAAEGWARGAERYGLTPHPATFGAINRWYYYSPGVPPPADPDALERAAAETLATERWRGDVRRWHDEVRPAVVVASRGLLAEDLTVLSDLALADHLERAVGHFLAHAPLHFAALAGEAAAGALFEAAVEWDLDRPALLSALAGSADATSSAEVLLDRVAAGLAAAGVTDVPDLAAVAAVGGDAAAALTELGEDYAWRLFNNDLAEPTLAERPEALVAAIRAAQAGRSPRTRPDPEVLARLRDQVPEADRARFDDLAGQARAAYGLNDDNTTVLYALPLGLVRRAALEVGRRLVAQGRLHDTDDVLEARWIELQALLAGAGPSADELAARSEERRRATDLVPPPMVGDPLPPSAPPDLPPSTRRLEAMLDAYRTVAWAQGSDPDRAAATVGTEVVRGRAVVAVDATDALLRTEPGDVLVVVTTTAAYNAVFPMAGAVAVEHGGVMSHAAVLARELGLTAVIGVAGLLQRVHDGDEVEVDPVAGTITVV